MNTICPNCGLIERTIAQQIGGKVTVGLAALAFGNQAKDPLVTALVTLAGVAVGHYIDQEVNKTCPNCGALLQIADFLL